MVEEGHKPLVHHMLLYACNFPLNDTFDGVGDFCYQKNKAEVISACTGTIFGWPTGGNVSSNVGSSQFVPFPTQQQMHRLSREKNAERNFCIFFLYLLFVGF